MITYLNFSFEIFIWTKATYFFVVQAVRKIISGLSVGKIIIIILSFRVGTSKNKNIENRVKENCAIMSTQVTYETDQIFTPWFNNVKCTKFLFYKFYCNLKEKVHIKRNINSKKKKEMFICAIIIIIILICQKLGSLGPAQQKLSCLRVVSFFIFHFIYFIKSLSRIFYLYRKIV